MGSGMRICVTLLVTAAAVGGCIGATTPSGAPPDDKTPGRWAVLAPMPSSRQELAVAEVGGKVYAVGGFGDSYEPVETVEAYDPAADRWEARGPVAVAGKIHALGGSQDRALNAHEVYDPAAGQWSPRNPMPTARDHLAVVTLG